MRTVVQWAILALLGTTLTVQMPGWVTPPPAPGDSGDTGDTGDSGDSGDTDDTADTGSLVDTADSAEPSDTADRDDDIELDSADTAVLDTAEPPRGSAAERAGESGDFGCSSVQNSVIGMVWALGFLAVVLRRRDEAEA